VVFLEIVFELILEAGTHLFSSFLVEVWDGIKEIFLK
jgi:hypothetical protein